MANAHIKELLKKYKGKKLDITFKDTTTFNFLDWEDLLDWKLDDGRHGSDIIYEYYIFPSKEIKEHIKKGEWVPVGVLGLSYGAGTHDAGEYAEMHNQGVILFDVTKKENLVALYYSSRDETGPEKIANSLQEFEQLLTVVKK
jgi:hypothetical protein